MKYLNYIKEWIENWNTRQSKKALLLHGPPGVGKTSTVYKVSDKLGFRVVEFNTSDNRGKDFIKSLFKLVVTKSFTPTVILLDEVDGMDSFRGLGKVLTKTVKPIIMTANNVNKIPSNIRTLCAEIHVYRPQLRDVIKQYKINKNIQDYRQAELMEKYGSEGYNTLSKTQILEDMIRKGFYYGLDKGDIIVLLRNAPRLFYGLDLYLFIKSLEVFCITERHEVLNGFKSSKGIRW